VQHHDLAGAVFLTLEDPEYFGCFAASVCDRLTLIAGAEEQYWSGQRSRVLSLIVCSLVLILVVQQ
jgi:hypothetical protein